MLRMGTTKCKTEALATQVVGCILCIYVKSSFDLHVCFTNSTVSLYVHMWPHACRVFIGREHPGISPIPSVQLQIIL